MLKEQNPRQAFFKPVGDLKYGQIIEYLKALISALHHSCTICTLFAGSGRAGICGHCAGARCR